MNIPAKAFYVIRHGETEANLARIMAGSLDSPLTANGRDQAAAARDIVKRLEKKPSILIHSNLSRARDTAAIINEALNVPMIEDPDFAEIDAGTLEGESYDQCEGIFTAWNNCPQGEAPSDFFARVKRGKIRALTAYEGTALIVCHGGVMRAIGVINGIETPGRFRNCHLHEFIPAPEQKPFAWTVFDYDRAGETITRTPSELYSNTNPAPLLAPEMA